MLKTKVVKILNEDLAEIDKQITEFRRRESLANINGNTLAVKSFQNEVATLFDIKRYIWNLQNRLEA